ncbi:MAG: type III-B CRISPR module RAMP protein Cmr4 [Caldilineaceae bacterium]|jgi:CRISPR-associated protein Cmr4
MFLAGRLLFLYAETALHVGSGSGLGGVDLPIQRERYTGFPLIQASGLKGALRSEVTAGKDSEKNAIFGPEDADYAGAVSPGDARLLLFPVRSLAGVFAWVTSFDVIARFQRDATALGMTDLPILPNSEPHADHAYVSGSAIVTGDAVVLEEFAFTVIREEATSSATRKLAEWLATNALPTSDEYKYWREKMRTNLVILPNDAYRDFTLHATEVITRVRLENETKTVAPGALWTQELLPPESVLYATVNATRLRMNSDKKPSTLANSDGKIEAENILQWMSKAEHIPHRFQVGGDETVGRGLVRIRWKGGA